MAIEIVIPQLGESVVEGTISKWLKKEGDKIDKDEPLVEIATDKINIEIPSPKAGTLGKIIVKEGTVVPVGELIGILAEPGESLNKLSVPASAGAKAEAQAPAQTAFTPSASVVTEEETDQKRLSPAVRRLIKEHNLDINRIKGTGSEGRITRDDVLAYIEQMKSAPAPARVETAPKPAPKSVPAYTPSAAAGAREEIIPMTQVRKIIAEHMVKSAYTAPHVTTWDEFDCTKLVEIREKLKVIAQEKYNIKLTYMPLIAKASVMALKEYPFVNASLEGDNIRLKKFYNIGMAVGRDSGLIVVVVKDCDKKSLLQIASEMTQLGDKARTDKLTLEDIQGSTFTLTNAGMYGALASTPIINYPEVAILGLHMIQKRPVVVDNQIVIREMMTACLSFDHRLIDGHYAVQFLHRIKNLIEHPEEWLLNAVLDVV
jgi:2-oxoglutarate dehydrogenase E2 component (dihydrolipoamide succinyltransferase)